MNIIHDTGGRSIGHQVLLDGVTVVDVGSWVSVKGFSPMTISVAMSGPGATAHICGSCALEKPLDAAHGTQIGVDVTASLLYELTAPLNWIKVRVSVHGGVTTNACVLGHYIK
jgi:hypothetical protein